MQLLGRDLLPLGQIHDGFVQTQKLSDDQGIAVNPSVQKIELFDGYITSPGYGVTGIASNDYVG